MSRITVRAFSVSVDGFGAGPGQNRENPPYHVPVFVLTRHARRATEMEGGTTFYYVTEGMEAAASRAREAAQGKDVRVGGGVATIRQFLQAKMIEEMHLAVSPVVMGSGEALYAGLNLAELGYRCRELVAGEKAMHVMFGREG